MNHFKWIIVSVSCIEKKKTRNFCCTKNVNFKIKLCCNLPRIGRKSFSILLNELYIKFQKDMTKFEVFLFFFNVVQISWIKLSDKYLHLLRFKLNIILNHCNWITWNNVTNTRLNLDHLKKIGFLKLDSKEKLIIQVDNDLVFAKNN